MRRSTSASSASRAACSAAIARSSSASLAFAIGLGLRLEVVDLSLQSLGLAMLGECDAQLVCALAAHRCPFRRSTWPARRSADSGVSAPWSMS